MIDLRAELPRLLPKAIDWAESQQADMLATGVPLSPEQIAMARRIGVAQPENISIKLVTQENLYLCIGISNWPQSTQRPQNNGTIVRMSFFLYDLCDLCG
ncbi:MAG TPA: hypothetical protein ACFYEC_04045 [Candidatus Brocadiaceae bacterium]